MVALSGQSQLVVGSCTFAHFYRGLGASARNRRLENPVETFRPLSFFFSDRPASWAGLRLAHLASGTLGAPGSRRRSRVHPFDVGAGRSVPFYSGIGLRSA